MDRGGGGAGPVHRFDRRTKQRDCAITRPTFIATFSFTPRFDNWTGVDEAMRATRVVEVHRGDPLRYRESMRSTSKNPRGWSLVKFDAALGAAFGGLFLLFAFKLHRAAVPG